MKSTITVTTPRLEVACPIWVGRGLIQSLATLLRVSSYSQAVVVVDAGAQGTGEQVRQSLGAAASSLLVLEGGEHVKTLESAERLWHFFTDRRLDRKSLVLAVGGGVVSDLVGFACSTYMRGIPCVTIPTTLLAQVDAGIGGKTGINFAGIKNLIGCVKQPAGIVVDVDTLATLPERQIRAGFAEIVKHGLIQDATYFQRATGRSCLSWSPDELVDIIRTSCTIKARIVEQDETEQGMRKALNFGHTLGHAIEAVSLEGPEPLTHGEAISVGMVAACFISQRLGMLSESESQVALNGLRNVGLPIHLEVPIRAAELFDAMSYDKKNVAGKNRWTLLQAVGTAVVDRDVPLEIVIEAIESIQPK